MMGLFSIDSSKYSFTIFSASHITVLLLFLIGCFSIFIFKENLRKVNLRKLEIGAAFSLLCIELLYHLWMYTNGIWNVGQSLPLELCSVSLILAIILLFTNSRLIFELLFFTSILGATQALLTPVLYFDFPHFRFAHFFLTHIMMIWVALYYTWVKGMRPTIFSVGKVILFLNILLPLVIWMNHITGGNYMFLSRKPDSASLLDYLGPYPFYILSMEGLLVGLSLILWLVFRERKFTARKHT